MFPMKVFYEGQTSLVAVSGSFNISSKATTTSSTSATSSSSSTVSTIPSTSTTTPISGSATISGSSTPPSNTGSGLSTGAKARIGVGAPLVAIFGVGMGYFIFRWRSLKNKTTPDMPTAQVQNKSDEYSVVNTNLQEMDGNRAANPAPYDNDNYIPELQ